jgi:hypothetical protein
MCFGVDRMGPYWTRSFMENPAFTGPSLSDITLMMVIMCVLVVELLCQAVTGWVTVLEFLLQGACGYYRLHPVMSDIK